MKVQRIELTDEQLDELADRVAEKVLEGRRRAAARKPVVSDVDKAAAAALARSWGLRTRNG
jgi:hypothetical protein